MKKQEKKEKKETMKVNQRKYSASPRCTEFLETCLVLVQIVRTELQKTGWG